MFYTESLNDYLDGPVLTKKTFYVLESNQIQTDSYAYIDSKVLLIAQQLNHQKDINIRSNIWLYTTVTPIYFFIVQIFRMAFTCLPSHPINLTLPSSPQSAIS